MTVAVLATEYTMLLSLSLEREQREGTMPETKCDADMRSSSGEQSVIVGLIFGAGGILGAILVPVPFNSRGTHP